MTNNQIWKFPLAEVGEQLVNMPTGATILHVDHQGGIPTLWALINTEAQIIERKIIIVGTGNEADHITKLPHIGTISAPPFVWHIFDGHEASNGEHDD